MKFLLVLALIMFSCTKSSSDTNTKCWHCQVGGAVGNAPAYETDTCVNGNEAPHFVDVNGNERNSYCEEK